MAANDSRRYGISRVAKQTESDVMVQDVNIKEVAKYLECQSQRKILVRKKRRCCVE